MTNPPIETPPVPPTPSLEDKFNQFMEFTTNQFNQLASQQVELSRAIAGNNTPKPQVAPTFDKDEFFSDPDKVITTKLEHMQASLRSEMAAQLAPVNSLAQQMQAQQRAAGYIQYLQNNPTTADVGKFSDILSNMLSNARGDIDANTLYGMYLAAKGMYYSRNPAPVQNTVVPSTPIQNQVPPYISPNTPVNIAPNVPGGQLRELTELEKRLCREQNISPAEFLYYGGEISEATFKALTTKA